MSLKDFFNKLKAEAEALAHLKFLKAAARQAIGNGLDVAFKTANAGTPEAVVVGDVNRFIEHVAGSMGPIVAAVAGLGEIGIDDAIHAAFSHYGTTASEAQLKEYIFSHLGL